jgi:uncharacterized ubiquitin-like protein YukD
MTIEELLNKHNLFVEITVDFSDGVYPMYDCTVIDLAICEKYPIVGFNRYMYSQALEYGIDAAEKIVMERNLIAKKKQELADKSMSNLYCLTPPIERDINYWINL